MAVKGVRAYLCEDREGGVSFATEQMIQFIIPAAKPLKPFLMVSPEPSA